MRVTALEGGGGGRDVGAVRLDEADRPAREVEDDLRRIRVGLGVRGRARGRG